MVTVKVNTSSVSRIKAGIGELDSIGKDKLLRTIIAAVVPEMRYRVHVDGLNEKGSPFGEYSNPYLKQRQKKHNRTADSKMVMSLTTQMENDLFLGESGTEEPIKTQQGYAIGFKNVANAEKYAHLSDTFGSFYKLSPAEKDTIKKTIDSFMKTYKEKFAK